MLYSYNHGINLGGWLSQYKKFDINHFDEYITENDIERIASWGLDHVRLPIDYEIIDNEHFHYIDDCIKWCEKRSLLLILDLHRAPGYSFDSLCENNLFESMELKEKFKGIWEKLAIRYSNTGNNLIFELLNEIVEPDSTRWNELLKDTINVIRKIDTHRKIIIGGNNYNSVHELKNIPIIDDVNIIYTFHFYEPHFFTHQGAGWMEQTKEYKASIIYPGSFDNYKEFLKENKKYDMYNRFLKYETISKDVIYDEINDAVEFINKNNVPVYCGEYGAIQKCDLLSRINYHRDFCNIANEFNIGRAVWTYKGKDFSMLNLNGEIISKELIKIISK